MEELQELVTGPGVGVERQSKDALRMGQATGAMEESVAQSVEFLKGPESRPTGRSVPMRRSGSHL